MPLKKIVVGVDLSPASDLAANRAAELAAQHGAELVLVHAATLPERPDVPASMQATADTWVKVLSDRLAADRHALGNLRERLEDHGVTVSQVLVDRYPDDALVEAATELDADLVVTGSRHRTGVRRWLLGSVAEHVVRHAPMSVLVAVPGDPDRGFERIVVGADFSDAAEHALARAIDLARPGSTIDVVHCFQLSLMAAEGVPTMGAAYDEVHKVLVNDARQRGEALLAAHANDRATLRFHFVEERPRDGLCDFAEHKHADLVVVGSHGRRGVRRLLLGSVAEAVVRHAPCSVLVVR